MAKPYNFADLSAEAKEKVIKRKYDDTVQAIIDPDWYEMTVEEFKEKIQKTYDIEVDDVQFSGFYSQGDGASFTFFKNYLDLMNEDIDKKGNIFLAGIPNDAMAKAVVDFIRRESRETYGGYMVSCECTRSDFRHVHERSVTPSVNLEVYSFDDVQTTIINYVNNHRDEFEGIFRDNLVDLIHLNPSTNSVNDYTDYDKEMEFYIGFDENQNGDFEQFQKVTVTINDLINMFDDSTGILSYSDIIRSANGIEDIIEEFGTPVEIIDCVIHIVGPEKFIEILTGKAPEGIDPYELYKELSGAPYVSEDDVQRIVDIMDGNLEELVISESKALYEQLRKEYEALTDESQVSDWLEANDTDQYDENGDPYVDRDSAYTYSELGRVAQTKLKNQFYDNYNFEDFNDAKIQEKIAKIRELGFVGVKFEITLPDTCKIIHTDIDYNKTKEWMLAGYKGTSIYDELINMDMRQLPDGVKQQAEDVKLQLLGKLEEKMSAWVAATYDSDISDEMIEEYYADDRFFEDGTFYEDPDEDEEYL